MKYIALKIAIKLRPDGTSHPRGHDGYEIDQYGIGMHYDRDGCESDVNGCMYAVTALPEDRALAYIARSSGGVTAMTEIEAETWFATHTIEPDEHFSSEILTIIKLKKDLAIPLTTTDLEALDSDNIRPGIVKNLRKGLKNKLPSDATL